MRKQVVLGTAEALLMAAKAIKSSRTLGADARYPLMKEEADKAMSVVSKAIEEEGGPESILDAFYSISVFLEYLDEENNNER